MVLVAQASILWERNLGIVHFNSTNEVNGSSLNFSACAMCFAFRFRKMLRDCLISYGTVLMCSFLSPLLYKFLINHKATSNKWHNNQPIFECPEVKGTL